MKKKPSHDFAKETGKKVITGQLTEESALRTQKWIQHGCNAFDSGNPTSNPLSFWTEQDILEYIYKFQLPIAEVYGEIVFDESEQKYKTTGVSRTGCVFCGFGLQREKGETRFQHLQRTHPNQYNYCLDGGEYDENGIWRPSKDGLGMKHIIYCQRHGDKFILWTCRTGKYLDEAVVWCKRQHLVFDAVNENLPERITEYGDDCRKVFADEYWDDKAYHIGFPRRFEPAEAEDDNDEVYFV